MYDPHSHRLSTVSLTVALLSLATVGASPVARGDAVERGRYLVQIAGCNDCHTAGYLMSEGQVPEAEWLKGDRFGWRGPWGTTYAANLRLTAARMNEAEWLDYMRSLRTRPPMPWYMLNKMHTEDLAAIYQYLRHLGPDGEPAPTGLSPGQTPAGPYALFPPAPSAEEP